MIETGDRQKSVHDLNSDLFAPEDDGRHRSPAEARKKAMDYLARREYGAQELTKKLESAGFDGAVAAQATRSLRDDGLQDDRRFVESFIQSRVNQGKGPQRIVADLMLRAIQGELIEIVLSECEADWYKLARDVRKKKFGQNLPLEFKEKARQMRFLQYRGFEQSHIQSALRAD